MKQVFLLLAIFIIDWKKFIINGRNEWVIIDFKTIWLIYKWITVKIAAYWCLINGICFWAVNLVILISFYGMAYVWVGCYWIYHRNILDVDVFNIIGLKLCRFFIICRGLLLDWLNIVGSNGGISYNCPLILLNLWIEFIIVKRVTVIVDVIQVIQAIHSKIMGHLHIFTNRLTLFRLQLLLLPLFLLLLLSLHL